LAGDDARVVCYFPYYSKDFNFFSTKVDPNLCTHIIYVYNNIDSATFNILPFDSTIDIEEGKFVS
jgi:GH18 family chitinase